MSITVASTYAWTIVAAGSESREMRVFLQKQLRILNQFSHARARERH